MTNDKKPASDQPEIHDTMDKSKLAGVQGNQSNIGGNQPEDGNTGNPDPANLAAVAVGGEHYTMEKSVHPEETHADLNKKASKTVESLHTETPAIPEKCPEKECCKDKKGKGSKDKDSKKEEPIMDETVRTNLKDTIENLAPIHTESKKEADQAHKQLDEFFDGLKDFAVKFTKEMNKEGYFVEDSVPDAIRVHHLKFKHKNDVHAVLVVSPVEDSTQAQVAAVEKTKVWGLGKSWNIFIDGSEYKQLSAALIEIIKDPTDSDDVQ